MTRKGAEGYYYASRTLQSSAVVFPLSSDVPTAGGSVLKGRFIYQNIFIWLFINKMDISKHRTMALWPLETQGKKLSTLCSNLFLYSMRIWNEKLIPSLCQKHLCAMWREGLGAYKIIVEHSTCSYSKHPATLEFINCPENLWQRLELLKDEATKRGYHFKDLPKYVKFGGQVKEWQTLEEQKEILKSKKCKCNF